MFEVKNENTTIATIDADRLYTTGDMVIFYKGQNEKVAYLRTYPGLLIVKKG